MFFRLAAQCRHSHTQQLRKGVCRLTLCRIWRGRPPRYIIARDLEGSMPGIVAGGEGWEPHTSS